MLVDRFIVVSFHFCTMARNRSSDPLPSLLKGPYQETNRAMPSCPSRSRVQPYLSWGRLYPIGHFSILSNTSGLLGSKAPSTQFCCCCVVRLHIDAPAKFSLPSDGVCRRLPSIANPDEYTTYTSEIVDTGDEAPVFRVTPEDQPDNIFEYSTSSGVWTQVSFHS